MGRFVDIVELNNTGPTGATGATGLPGITGATGPSGITGATGPNAIGSPSAVTGNIVLTGSSNQTVLVNTTVPSTITLPNPTSSGQSITIVDSTGLSEINNITLSRGSGTYLINGYNDNIILARASGIWQIVADGTNYNITLSTENTIGVTAQSSICAPVQNVTTSTFNISSAADAIYLVDTTSSKTLYLPDPSSNVRITIKDKTGTASQNPITVSRNGKNYSIEGSKQDYIIQSDENCVTFVSDGNNYWNILSGGVIQSVSPNIINSGTGATIGTPSAGFVNVTGLSNITSNSIGHYLGLSGSNTNFNNNRFFLITSVSIPSQVTISVDGYVTSNSGLTWNEYIPTTANTSSDTIMLVETSANNIISLPLPSLNQKITVKDIYGSTRVNNILLARNSNTYSIDGYAGDYTYTKNYGSIQLVSDGNHYYISNGRGTVNTINSSPYTITSEGTYLVDTTSARTINVNLTTTGQRVTIKDKTGSASTNYITINCSSGQIFGISTNYAEKTFVHNGENYWEIFGGFATVTGQSTKPVSLEFVYNNWSYSIQESVKRILDLPSTNKMPSDGYVPRWNASKGIYDNFSFPTSGISPSDSQTLVWNASNNYYDNRLIYSTSVPSGRLTLTSATPITTSDVTAATTLYYTPYNGNYILLYNSSIWASYNFTEISISIPSTSSTIYDVFVYLNSSSIPTLEFSNAWSNNTTRTDSIIYLNGILVKSSNTTRRYVGTIMNTSVSGQTEDSKANRLIWNYYNRIDKPMLRKESATNWTYATNTWRQANTNTANALNYVVGYNEDILNVSLIAASTVINTAYGSVGIGIDSSSTPNYFSGMSTSTTTTSTVPFAVTYQEIPTNIGYHTVYWLETSLTGTTTFYGTGGTSVCTSSLKGVIKG